MSVDLVCSTTDLPGKIGSLCNSGYGSNQPFSDWLKGLLHWYCKLGQRSMAREVRDLSGKPNTIVMISGQVFKLPSKYFCFTFRLVALIGHRGVLLVFALGRG